MRLRLVNRQALIPRYLRTPLVSPLVLRATTTLTISQATKRLTIPTNNCRHRRHLSLNMRDSHKAPILFMDRYLRICNGRRAGIAGVSLHIPITTPLSSLNISMHRWRRMGSRCRTHIKRLRLRHKNRTPHTTSATSSLTSLLLDPQGQGLRLMRTSHHIPTSSNQCSIIAAQCQHNLSPRPTKRLLSLLTFLNLHLRPSSLNNRPLKLGQRHSSNRTGSKLLSHSNINHNPPPKATHTPDTTKARSPVYHNMSLWQNLLQRKL